MCGIIRVKNPPPVVKVKIECSVHLYSSPCSRRRNQAVRNSTNQFICSDSEESQDVQEERRADFEKFRNQKKLKRKVPQFEAPQFEAPQFAIGQPLSNDNLKISALFPRLEDTNCQPGRVNTICHVPIWHTLKNHQKINLCQTLDF